MCAGCAQGVSGGVAWSIGRGGLGEGLGIGAAERDKGKERDQHSRRILGGDIKACW
jgi:hypothetical protein